MIVQAKRPRYTGGYLDRVLSIHRRFVSDRCNDDPDLATLLTGCHDNRCRAVLGRLVLARRFFVAPEEAVTNDQAHAKGRQAHRGSPPYSAASRSVITSS